MSRFTKHIVGVFLASLATASLAARGEDAPAPIYWNQSVFSIPYQINRPATADDAPLEVRLLVSRDAGENWETLQSAQPHVKGFIYNAEQQDGHYWFAVQTVDRYGRQHPQTDIRPELHVVVDTIPPQLKVNAEVDAKGDVVIHCQQEDANLGVEKLSVNVRPENGNLQPMQVPQGELDGSSRLVHDVTCVPPLGTRSIQVRAETSDLAGNHGIAQIELDLVTARQRPVGLETAAVGADASALRPVGPAGTAAASGSSAWSPAGEASYPQAQLGLGGSRQNALLDPPQLVAGGGADASSSGNTQAWPVDRTALAGGQTGVLDRRNDPPIARNSGSGQSGGFEQLPPPPIASAAPGGSPSWSARQTSAPLAGQSPEPSASAPGTLSSGPALAPAADSGPQFGSHSVVAAPTEEIGVGEVLQQPAGGARTLGGYPDTGAPSLNMGWAGGEGPSLGQAPTTAGRPDHPAESVSGWQMVNSRTIAIDYEVASLGPWGVSAVELWGTTDGGQSWRRYAVDDDNRSPVTATVEGEGDYGFRVLVHSAGGFAAAPPRQGDAPEALVRVDLVRPEATLNSVQQGTGNLADQIMIRWSASDAELGPQPITLYYAAQPAGPWSIIAANLVNSGSYAWRADRHLPEQLYVRLEVRDAAGNTTTYQTADPVVVNRPRPQVRIREIRSFDAAPVQGSSGP